MNTTERDQLAEIALLMNRYYIYEHTEDSLTIESVEVLVEGMKEAWEIINMLNISGINNAEPYPGALEWLEKWGDLNPQVQNQPETSRTN